MMDRARYKTGRSAWGYSLRVRSCMPVCTQEGSRNCTLLRNPKTRTIHNMRGKSFGTHILPRGRNWGSAGRLSPLWRVGTFSAVAGGLWVSWREGLYHHVFFPCLANRVDFAYTPVTTTRGTNVTKCKAETPSKYLTQAQIACSSQNSRQPPSPFNPLLAGGVHAIKTTALITTATVKEIKNLLIPSCLL